MTRPDGLSSSYMVIAEDEDDEKYVDEYPWRERYDPQKTYTREPFKACYNDGQEHTYRYEFNEMRRRGTNVIERWIVAVEHLGTEEQDALAPFCQCVACHVPWWACERWGCASCAECVGCLGGSFVQQHQINAAREAQAGHPRNQPRWTPLYKSTGLWIGMAGVFAFIVAAVYE